MSLEEIDSLIAEANENIPRDLSDWANLAVRLRSALERIRDSGMTVSR